MLVTSGMMDIHVVALLNFAIMLASTDHLVSHASLVYHLPQSAAYCSSHTDISFLPVQPLYVGVMQKHQYITGWAEQLWPRAEASHPGPISFSGPGCSSCRCCTEEPSQQAVQHEHHSCSHTQAQRRHDASDKHAAIPTIIRLPGRYGMLLDGM